MSARRVLAPLVAASTWRRGVFLLLGGVLALPYALLAVIFAQMFAQDAVSRLLVLGLLVVAVAIAAVPLFLDGSRSLEIAAARSLLGVDLPDPVPGHTADRETRLRSALWITLHLVSGGAVVAALIGAVPMALAFIAHPLGFDTGLAAQDLGPFDGRGTGWLALAGVVALVALGYAVAGLGALAASMAPVLLGPAETERVAALEARAARLAERNRLARELHDSVGHALTVTTLQAGAAREMLDRDSGFVRRALTAIEDAGRGAMDDLDHVLGLLRETDAEREGPVPRRTLADLDRLLADTRATGLPVEAQTSGDLAGLPAALSREAYRIVQEGLTNAARHGRGPATIRLEVGPEALELELVNALGRAGRPDSGRAGRPEPGRVGRGLAGIRERVLLFGGELTGGPDADRWRILVRLPLPGPR